MPPSTVTGLTICSPTSTARMTAARRGRSSRAGFQSGAFVNAVREDPVRPRLLYAGTELGVYVSFNDGAAWQPLQFDLPVTSVRDLAIRRGSLAIATHGRGFWVLDDLSPLYQVTARMSEDRTRLFAPETAVRVRPHGDPAERLPPEEPAGQNRPVGAYVDYFVGSSAANRSGLTRDPRCCRHPCAALLEHRPRAAGRRKRAGFSVVLGIAGAAALVRCPACIAICWDFAYAAPAILGTPPFGPGGDDGVIAPPGRYSVRLSAAGRTLSQSLTVVEDPRVAVSTSDLMAQFQLARSIESLRVADRAEQRAREGDAGTDFGDGQQTPDVGPDHRRPGGGRAGQRFRRAIAGLHEPVVSRRRLADLVGACGKRRFRPDARRAQSVHDGRRGLPRGGATAQRVVVVVAPAFMVGYHARPHPRGCDSSACLWGRCLSSAGRP